MPASIAGISRGWLASLGAAVQTRYPGPPARRPTSWPATDSGRHPFQKRRCGPSVLLVAARPGLTITELFVVIAIIAVLLALLLPVLSRAKSSSQNVACLANLRHISLALNLYAHDNQQQLPLPSEISKMSWESTLRPYVTAREGYHCLSDGGAYERYGSSYDWRDTGDIKTTAAGKTLVEFRRSTVVFTFDALPDWHGQGLINAALMDGSASTMHYQECLRDLDTPVSD